MKDLLKEGDVTFTLKYTHIDLIRAGDIVLHNDKLMTVCNKDIKFCGFMGRSIFGDTYSLGRKPVKKAEIFHVK